MAAPLLGHRGYAVGAIVIAGPSVNLDQGKLESWTAELTAAAQEISIAMGADLPDLQLAVRGGPESANAVTCALRIPAHLGSSPVWDQRCSRLYWIDILAPSINQFDPASGENRAFYMDDLMGGIALHHDEHLLIAAMRRGIYLFDTRTEELELLAESSETSTEHRFNKGACDLHGRFWTSSMHMGGRPESGKLFRLDPGGRLEVVDSGLTLPNALSWSPDWKQLYLTDSAARTIYVYDFDPARGEIENRRPLLRVPPHLGRPTGLTVDREGFLWSTHADGWRVTRYAPDGEVASFVSLPVPTANGCGFGGPKLDKLFITTGRERLSSLRLANAPLAGSIFVHEPGTRGIAPCRFGTKCP
jgi:sugar lactone lactonase YvrE